MKQFLRNIKLFFKPKIMIIEINPNEKIELAQNDLPKKLNWHDAKSCCEKMGEDWRLPTKSELKFIYSHMYLKGIGNFQRSVYWCSEEAAAAHRAYFVAFWDGNSNNGDKK